MKKIIILFVLSFICIMGANAQTRQYYTLSWDMGTPIGEFRSFAKNWSLYGGVFSGQIIVGKQCAIGFSFGYHKYYQNKGVETFSPEEGTVITAAAYNYVNDAPLTVGGYYHFTPNNPYINVYAGLGIGLNYIAEHSLIQDMDLYDEQWAFIMAPEVGAFVRLGKKSPVALNVSAKYNVSFNQYIHHLEKLSPYQTLTVGIGLSYILN
ncbi:MAG: hypothetical protein RR190_04265 [Bacteroidales bacterium]